MTSAAPSPEEVVINLLIGAVPERKADIVDLFTRLNVAVDLIEKRPGITLHTRKGRIAFDAKTIDIFWLIGFSGWKALECYCPAIIFSESLNEPVAKLLENDTELGNFERLYKERLAVARSLIGDLDGTQLWPPDVPRPSANRNAVDDPQYQATFDLMCSAVAFTLFHEIEHAIFDNDPTQRPNDPREEELFCDVFARQFMTSKAGSFAANTGQTYEAVLRRRCMALALAALIIHEITPQFEHGGNQEYFSLKVRLQAIVTETKLQEFDSFWIFVACLLVGIFRQTHRTIDAPPLNPRALADHLISVL